ncbi:unnamed protein product [Urochloa humidicola]
MTAGSATLRALLVLTLASFLLIHGVAGKFECCFCNCYNDCKLSNPGLPKEACHWRCFENSACRFSCKNKVCRRMSSGGDDGVGVAIASGGGSLGMVNGTEAGGAVAAGAGGGSLGVVNATGEGAAP